MVRNIFSVGGACHHESAGVDDDEIARARTQRGIAVRMRHLVAKAVAHVLLRSLRLKRLHDRNKSAWWLGLFYAVPFLLDTSAYLKGPDYALYFTVPAGIINVWALIMLSILLEHERRLKALERN